MAIIVTVLIKATTIYTFRFLFNITLSQNAIKRPLRNRYILSLLCNVMQYNELKHDEHI